MSVVGQKEILTQQCVVEFFQDALGYAYLGDWQGRQYNSNMETSKLAMWLAGQEHDDTVIDKTLYALHKAAGISGSTALYDANREVYSLLRYGMKVQPAPGKQRVTVWLIDWANPAANHFAIAEEVTIAGENNKRPDILIYVNGITFGVLELKRSTVSVAEGIRQNIDSQKKEFIRPFSPRCNS